MLIASWLVVPVLVAVLFRLIVQSARHASRTSPGSLAASLGNAFDGAGARVALTVVLLLVIIAVLAPWLAPYSPWVQGPLELQTAPPSMAHLLGTDEFSRDVLSRVLHGARVSLGVGVLAVLISGTVGLAWGAIAGFRGGAADMIMMRLLDAALSVPRLLILVAMLALWRVSLLALILILGLTGWFHVSRLVRAEVLSLRQQEFALAARALGARGSRVLWRHLVPNALSPVIVAVTLGVGHVIVVEAVLSYLGIGVRPPTPSWGNMIRDGVDHLRTAWWISVFPGLAIVATVMAFNVLGDSLRDALDPRQNEQA